MNLMIFILVVAVTLSMMALGLIFSKSRQNIEEYISARSSMGRFSSMATIVASVMGAWILFSPAEAATWAGLIAVIGYALGQAAPVLAFIFVGPRVRKLAPNGHSLSEFTWFRFGRLMYALILAITMLYMFTFLAAEMGAIARAVRLVTDAPLIITLIFVGASTMIYTTYGGLRASIFTDKIQFLLIIPLLGIILIATISQLGGWGESFASVRNSNDSLLKLSHQPGIEFGITLFIAILAAKLFHQGFWQRIYAAKSIGDAQRGFLAASIIIIPMIIAAGLFGLWAVGAGLVDSDRPGSIALFSLALEVLPQWTLFLLVALAVVLVMSSMDTLLNGIASIITADLPRLKPSLPTTHLLKVARIVTAVLIIPAALIGYAFDSVLYLFLIADLVCAGAMVPTFSGLWLSKIRGTHAAISSILGISTGALFFPKSDLSGWWTWDALSEFWHILASGNLLASFTIAIVISTSCTLVFSIWSRFAKTEDFEFKELSNQIKALENS